MKAFYLNTFIMVIITCNVFAQKSAIVGKVFDSQNQPIAGANVLLKGTVRGVQTNRNGDYIIKGLQAGKYQILVSFVGYYTVEKIAEVSVNQQITIDLNLPEASQTLKDIQVVANRGVRGNEYLADVDGYTINAAKKNELIRLAMIDANLAMNNSRQIFGRVPGISVWESDGSGIQTNIASRGLSPNRSWEFNTRLNGYDITPDPMGYPEAYYTPPMEVVEKIEIVRGASSLQYGPQFGGLLNFVLRKPDASNRFTVESQNTVGSNGLLSTFNYIGGTEGKLSYTIYYQKRKGNGWRENSYFNTDHAHIELSYAISNKLKMGTEITYMDYISQQAGGLTDAQFAQNSQQSVRSRNWFSAPWLVPALTADYVFNEKTRLNFKIFGTLGERNSIGFTKAINIVDDNGSRQIDRDFYKNIGSELRLITDYKLLKLKNTLATGLRFFSGNTERWQLGTGDSESGFSTTLQPNTSYQKALNFQNQNFSMFAENIFRINKKLLFTAGVRYEYIKSNASGRLSFINGQENLIGEIARTRSFMIAGLGAAFHPNSATEFYTNYSQAYRPVLFGDLTPPATTDVIDPNLKDARGFNFDFGYRGKLGKFLNFDADYFYVSYDNRIGTITQKSDTKTYYQFRTNIGNSISKGFEGYIEFDPIAAFISNKRWGNLSAFISMAYIDAKYQDFRTTSVVNGQIIEGTLSGKSIENAPQKINRYGITYSKKGFSLTWQISDIGEAFADASNTIIATAAATTGLIPAYRVQDISGSIKILKHYNLKMGVNNLTNESYFTRRSGGYPGPGILPADGRTFYVSAGVKF